MVNDVLTDLQASFDKAIESFKRDLSKVRTGRANISMLDGLDYQLRHSAHLALEKGEDNYASPQPHSWNVEGVICNRRIKSTRMQIVIKVALLSVGNSALPPNYFEVCS